MPTHPALQAATTRHAFVTGASSGIGRTIAECLLADDWRVTGLRRTTPTEPVEGLEVAQMDVTGFAWLSKICDGLGAVDALVHAAGFIRTAPLGVLYTADGTTMWHVHVDAAVFLTDRLVPRMPAGGRILLTGSRTTGGTPARSQYIATKAALVGMARSWATELAPRSITVNMITPGATDTPFLHNPARIYTPPHMPPIGRFTTPEETMAIAASQTGKYGGATTGQQVVMCGGASLQRWCTVRKSHQNGANARWSRRAISLTILTSCTWLYSPVHERHRSLDPLQ